ncbi:hypothetical protein TGPRC2_218955 [Toxoplasma gondii TgCatPRC2]|uniref:Uncharacterized protein n=12 Tax=Toxoplasma gondii TaxID=5811 RepID=A0A125YSX8_TOXGV|nr:hypothetical protein TGME49_218955 [Toxoplasma gondii ME49]EPR63909.1 hypothetical protein TGGT1_218955 [Toxoplasma gondii GT1]ESS28878.1 hypothetical protein TGVEG_218955 [Toxoplasma gondii VEG]KAF4638247.1 hypothetical protein TGRH88_058540 [Toxoplasma gondii]KFG38212.1 hypothetical protein TGP89_218955 [Toxoplasma gondii p89]KFG47613.1 hypothetical protein TGDOM2_218955 [Toxoplasma gondii GAB2-2007-GAL-DOM2]KFG50855.1 hypothetical protein TGFOU_218955 [Toxoplasma gondii FOU]KFH15765.1 |eukprot:XP_018634820.1 hypothetical protein TGME49_218955 [Toxoplasma gondii ME49]
MDTVRWLFARSPRASPNRGRLAVAFSARLATGRVDCAATFSQRATVGRARALRNKAHLLTPSRPSNPRLSVRGVNAAPLCLWRTRQQTSCFADFCFEPFLRRRRRSKKTLGNSFRRPCPRYRVSEGHRGHLCKRLACGMCPRLLCPLCER